MAMRYESMIRAPAKLARLEVDPAEIDARVGHLIGAEPKVVWRATSRPGLDLMLGS